MVGYFMKNIFLGTILIIYILLLGCTSTSSDSIRDISQNPQSYVGKEVNVVGIVGIITAAPDLSGVSNFVLMEENAKSYYIRIKIPMDDEINEPYFASKIRLRGVYRSAELCQCFSTNGNRIVPDKTVKSCMEYFGGGGTECRNNYPYYYLEGSPE